MKMREFVGKIWKRFSVEKEQPKSSNTFNPYLWGGDGQEGYDEWQKQVSSEIDMAYQARLDKIEQGREKYLKVVRERVINELVMKAVGEERKEEKRVRYPKYI